MAKTLQFRDGSEDGPTGKFLLAVTHEAHRTLAPDQAEGVVAEVRDHLTAQVETQVMNGVARSHAERDAVGNFGTARSFVRGVSASLHDTRRAKIARDVAFGSAVLALAGGFLYCCRFGPSPWASEYIVITGTQGMLLVPPVAAIIVASWLGWRANPRRFALLGVAFIAALALWTGFDTVTLTPKAGASVAPWEYEYPRHYSRSYMRRAADTATIWRDMARADVERLEAGVQVFIATPDSIGLAFIDARLQRLKAQAEEISRQERLAVEASKRRQLQSRSAMLLSQAASLQTELEYLRISENDAQQLAALTMKQAAAAVAFRTPTGSYLVPREFNSAPANQSAFVSLSRLRGERGTYQSDADYARTYQKLVRQTSPVEFQNYRDARKRWQQSGPVWLKTRRHELAYRERMLETCRRVEAAPFGFNAPAVGRLLVGTPLLLLPFGLVVLNVVPATLARLTRRAWDGWLWRIRSTS